MRRLIVNADDFGLSPGANYGIVEAHSQGIVTSASLMANMPGAEQAAALARRHPTLDLGVHLCLTAGSALVPYHGVSSLTRRDGRLLPFGEFVARLGAGRIALREIERELEMQVEQALALGVRPSHLDSHHHVHVLPGVREIVVGLARRFGVRAVRCPLEPPAAVAGMAARDRVRALLLLGFARGLRRLLAASGLHTTQHFRGLALGHAFDPGRLERVLRALPEGDTELMVHPGYPDPTMAALTRYARGRERELRTLTEPRCRALLADLGVALTTYAALARVRAAGPGPAP